MGIAGKKGSVRRSLPRSDQAAFSEDNAVNPHILVRQDVRRLAAELPEEAARGLVDYYYRTQGDRLATEGQLRAARQDAEPNALVGHFTAQMYALEQQVKSVLDIYSDNQLLGRWAKSIRGIGPVLASGLLAHIRFQDNEGRPYETASSLWSFAGLDPTVEWGKGEKRPWNARLKVIAWKVGESFVLQSGRPDDVYGKVYAARKLLEQSRNEQGLLSDQAAAALASKNYGDDTVAKGWYLKGMLPPAHIHMRAKRYAVKLFLAHYHEVGYFIAFGRLPPFPYVVEKLDHRDVIVAPHAELVPGLPDAQRIAIAASGRLRAVAI